MLLFSSWRAKQILFVSVNFLQLDLMEIWKRFISKMTDIRGSRKKWLVLTLLKLMKMHLLFPQAKRIFAVQFVRRSLCVVIIWGKSIFIAFPLNASLPLHSSVIDINASVMLIICSKHARRHPNFDLNTLRQRRPSSQTVQSTASRLVKEHSINSSECASDSTSSESILGT